jgi:hypothetical protein
MGRRPRPSIGVRAIVAAIALYALLLQGFLGIATPSLALGADGILCTDHGSATPDGKSGTRHEHQCCLPVQLGSLAPPPVVATEAGWLLPAAEMLVFRPEADRLATGPPARAHQPRGPPLA